MRSSRGGRTPRRADASPVGRCWPSSSSARSPLSRGHKLSCNAPARSRFLAASARAEATSTSSTECSTRLPQPPRRGGSRVHHLLVHPVNQGVGHRCTTERELENETQERDTPLLPPAERGAEEELCRRLRSAFVAELGESETRPERDRLERAVKELGKIDATPEELSARLRTARISWSPSATITPQGHRCQLGGVGPPGSTQCRA